MTKSRNMSIRLADPIYEAYEEMATEQGIKASTYIKDVLTLNIHRISVKHEVDRLEQIAKDIQQDIKEFKEELKVNEKFYEDFATTYMMLLWLMMKENATKEEVKEMQKRGLLYSQQNFFGDKK